MVIFSFVKIIGCAILLRICTQISMYNSTVIMCSLSSRLLFADFFFSHVLIDGDPPDDRPVPSRVELARPQDQPIGAQGPDERPLQPGVGQYMIYLKLLAWCVKL